MNDVHDLVDGYLEILTRFEAEQENEFWTRRAISANYYIMFHTLCIIYANYFVGVDKQNDERWRLMYRSLNHGECKTILNRFANDKNAQSSIQSFSKKFCEMQEYRHLADYDPFKFPLNKEKVLEIGREINMELNLFYKVDDKTYDSFALALHPKSRK